MKTPADNSNKLGPNSYWGDLTTNSFNTINPERTIAVLPVAAVEQHGPHLPLNTDAQICKGLVERVLDHNIKGLQVIALPVIEIGESSEHRDFPGTLGLTAEQLISLWTSLGKQVCRTGIRKLLILNTHGGQPGLVDIVAQRLRTENQMFVVGLNSFQLGIPEGLFDKQEIEHGIHAGEIETSIMLYLRSETVHMDQAKYFKPVSPLMQGEYKLIDIRGPGRVAWQAQDLNPSGAVGRARNADPKRGGILMQHMVERVTKVLQEMTVFQTANIGNGG